MKKVMKIVVSVIFVTFLSGCLVYCMIAGAGQGKGTFGYMIMAGILAVGISVTLCAGYHYIRSLQKKLEEMNDRIMEVKSRIQQKIDVNE